MPEITPATAVGVTATAKILGVELTAQGDALLAQGISNLKPRDNGDKNSASSKSKPQSQQRPKTVLNGTRELNNDNRINHEGREKLICN